MRIVINKPIYLEIVPEDTVFLKENTIFFDGTHIIPQKCDLPEEFIWKFLELLESYDYNVDLRMYNIGRFVLTVDCMDCII